MVDWDAINREAERLADELSQADTELDKAKKLLDEAEKLKDYFLFKNCDEFAVRKYLDTMATNPPPRSRQTPRCYQTLRDIWNRWNTSLTGIDKARAWGLAVRIAKARKRA